MEVADTRRLKNLESENARLKRLVAEQALALDALKEFARGKSQPRSVAGACCSWGWIGDSPAAQCARLPHAGSGSKGMARWRYDLSTPHGLNGYIKRSQVKAPNKPFKPNLPRYGKHIEERAGHCHSSTTQAGLIHLLCFLEQWRPHCMHADYAKRSYRLGREPTRMAQHNAKTWAKLQQELAVRGSATYERLVALSKGHESGTKGAPHPHQFVDYCIRSGWLEPTK